MGFGLEGNERRFWCKLERVSVAAEGRSYYVLLLVLLSLVSLGQLVRSSISRTPVTSPARNDATQPSVEKSLSMS